MSHGKGSAFEKAMGNGLVATIAWFLLLVLYSVFRALHVDAPGLDQAFLLLTGGWVGMLTLAQSRKSQKVEEDVKEIKKIVVEQQEPDDVDG
jgi:hypothetical protein